MNVIFRDKTLRIDLEINKKNGNLFLDTRKSVVTYVKQG